MAQQNVAKPPSKALVVSNTINSWLIMTELGVQIGTVLFYLVAALSVRRLFYWYTTYLTIFNLRWLWRKYIMAQTLMATWLRINLTYSNKWVLNTTSAPLFFLLSQLFIAIILFIGAHFAGLIQIPLQLDIEVCKGLVPMVALNVIGLRYAHIPSHAQAHNLTRFTVRAITLLNTLMRHSTKSLVAWSFP